MPPFTAAITEWDRCPMATFIYLYISALWSITNAKSDFIIHSWWKGVFAADNVSSFTFNKN